jgi:hypothetical protein
VAENSHGGLPYLIQYRRKDGIKWTNMAAFDVQGAAETYYEKQRNDPKDDWPWEYRLIEVQGEG